METQSHLLRGAVATVAVIKTTCPFTIQTDSYLALLVVPPLSGNSCRSTNMSETLYNNYITRNECTTENTVTFIVKYLEVSKSDTYTFKNIKLYKRQLLNFILKTLTDKTFLYLSV